MVFRDPESCQKAMRVFHATWIQKTFTLYCYCFMGRSARRQKKIFLFNRWIDVRNAGLPDEILWQNLGYSRCQRTLYRAIVWVIALALIFLAVASMTLIKYKADNLKQDFQTDIQCPPEVSKLSAYLDQQKEEKQRVGLMHCYCLHVYDVWGTSKTLTMSFTDINS